MISDAVRIAVDALIKPFEGYHRGFRMEIASLTQILQLEVLLDHWLG